MKKLFLSSALATVAVVTIQAQTVADAMKDIYYEKYKSANTKLQQLVTKNPADVDAEYWLGQAYLDQDDLAGARSTYAKAMTATNQAPLIMVGMGHTELLEGKNADARAHFDAALAASGKKGDVKVLTAVGRANADGDSKTGDPAYGLDKLQVALPIATKSNPDMVAEIQTLIGISQLKRGPEYGGQAKQAFDQALAADPKNARAKLRTARIFLSQRNTDIFLPLMEDATKIDPDYAPAYLALYNYYSERDVNKAKVYLDQYVAKADKDCNNDFYLADYLLRAGKRDESLAKAKEMESTCGGDGFPQLNKLYALIYSRNGDSVQARDYLEKYLQKQVPAKLTAEDYSLAAGLYSKFPGDAAKASQALDQALSLDTSVASRVRILTDLSTTYASQQNYPAQYNVLERLQSIRPDTSARAKFEIITAALNSKLYDPAITYAQSYVRSYPTQAQGYYLWTKAAIAQDADTSKGTAIPSIEQYINFLKADTAKNKGRIITFYGYEVYYYVNKVKDYPKALEAVNGILSVDPTNSYALNAKKPIENLINPPARPATPATPKKPATPATPATKPKTTGK